jgi:hypothetical protein
VLFLTIGVVLFLPCVIAGDTASRLIATVVLTVVASVPCARSATVADLTPRRSAHNCRSERSVRASAAGLNRGRMNASVAVLAGEERRPVVRASGTRRARK